MSYPYQQQNFHQNYGNYVPQHPNQYPRPPNQYPHPNPLPFQPQPNFQIIVPPSPQYGYSYQPSSASPLMMGNHQQSRVLQDVQPNTPRQQMPAKAQPQYQAPEEEVDYAVLLLALADEYLDVAYASVERSEEYYKLVATALGCLESVLNNFKLQPLREAQVSLKYAQILLDETENNDDAEKVLTRAIEVCERNKLFDLKYASQSLLARVLHRSRPKAAIKDVQGMIEDVEVYHHVAWEYCFRFLHASLSLSSATTHDLHSAISQFEKISAVARRNGDHAVYAFAAIMEALMHLQSNTTESVTSAQRALATARQMQLSPDVEENPQMLVMMEFIDLCCSLWELNLSQMEQKVKAMQQGLYQVLEKPGWTDNGALSLPVSKRSLNGVAVQDGGLVSEKGGKVFLTMTWLSKGDIEILGYVLSAASVAHKNAADGGKAEKFILEGLGRLRSLSSEEGALYGCLPGSELLMIWRKTLECHLLLENAFLMCARGSWSLARELMEEVESVSLVLGTSLRPEMKCMLQYLNGVIHQGTGDTETALAVFESPIFALSPAKATPDSHHKKAGRPSSRHNDHPSEIIRNISLLAGMNIAMIVHSPTHPQNSHLSGILTTLESLVHSSSNKHIQASYSLLLAILSDASVLKQKQFLGSALTTAQGIGNAQITALTLILMSEKFFKGVVGEQAAKCAKAASHQARRVGDPLWISVSGGMESECMGVQGRREDARRLREEAERVAEGLPVGVREGMGGLR